MSAQPPDLWLDQFDDPPVRLDRRIDPQREDAFWEGVHRREPYYRDGLDYEDYAPAYCVGYVGYAQYGGSYDDAEKSLCANWCRLQGASRLSFDEAMQAVRAAWLRAARVQAVANTVKARAKPAPARRALAAAASHAEPTLAVA